MQSLEINLYETHRFTSLKEVKINNPDLKIKFYDGSNSEKVVLGTFNLKISEFKRQIQQKFQLIGEEQSVSYINQSEFKKFLLFLHSGYLSITPENISKYMYCAFYFDSMLFFGAPQIQQLLKNINDQNNSLKIIIACFENLDKVKAYRIDYLQQFLQNAIQKFGIRIFYRGENSIDLENLKLISQKKLEILLRYLGSAFDKTDDRNILKLCKIVDAYYQSLQDKSDLENKVSQTILSMIDDSIKPDNFKDISQYLSQSEKNKKYQQFSAILNNQLRNSTNDEQKLQNELQNFKARQLQLQKQVQDTKMKLETEKLYQAGLYAHQQFQKFKKQQPLIQRQDYFGLPREFMMYD